MKRYILAIILLLPIFACTAQNKSGNMSPDADPTTSPNSVGTYTVSEVDPIGDEYGGRLTISAGNETGAYN